MLGRMQTRAAHRTSPAARSRGRAPLRAPFTSGAAAALAILAVLACRGKPGAEPPAETVAAAGLVRIGAIDWYVDYAAALEVARERDRPLWVHFGEHPG
jgi:hypothetical protein